MARYTKIQSTCKWHNQLLHTVFIFMNAKPGQRIRREINAPFTEKEFVFRINNLFFGKVNLINVYTLSCTYLKSKYYSKVIIIFYFISAIIVDETVLIQL